jgi:uncharacterized protein
MTSHNQAPPPVVMLSSGKLFNLVTCEPKLDVGSIGRGLARAPRFAGQLSHRFRCDEHYSVAEHSVHVSDFCRRYGRRVALWGLLHDASECVTGDLPSPLKALLPGFAEIERRIQDSILDSFGLDPAKEPESVKRWDLAVMHAEMLHLMEPEATFWIKTQIDPAPLTPQRWTPSRAYQEWISRVCSLTRLG